MTTSIPLLNTNADQPARICYQSFVDPQEQRPYMLRLQEALNAYAAPHVRFEVHGVSPPDRFLSPLTELRCAAQAIRRGIQAQQQGHDASVIGLGEATMLFASMLGRTFGLVTINPVFIPWHREQINRLGLGQRAVGVR